jgi:hypothetical protein
MAFRRQLHQSALNVLNMCGQKFKFRYLEHRKSPSSSYLICGKSVDKAVGYDLNTKILTGDLAREDEILDIARDAVVNDPDAAGITAQDEDETGKSNQQIIDATKDKAVRLVTAHHSLVAPEIKPFRTARRFSISLDKFLRQRAATVHKQAEMADNSWEKRTLHREGEALNAAARQGWDFAGEVDLLEGTPVDGDKEKLDTSKPFKIRDLKTSKKSKNQADVDSDDQLTSYCMSSMVIDGRLPDAVGLDVLVDLKSGVKPQLLSSFRKPEDIDVYLNRIANAVSSIQQGVFVPARETDWWCSSKWCQYAPICPYFKHPRSTFFGDLSGVADDKLPILGQPNAQPISGKNT